MPSLTDRCAAEYERAGLDGVNRYLNEAYPDLPSRVRAMQELEAADRWRILWHTSRDTPDAPPDDGVVVEHYG
jgi:hypothetical protein